MKNLQLFNKTFWSNISFGPLNIYNKPQMIKVINQFWKKIMSNLDINTVVGLFLKVEFSDGTHKSLSKLQRITKANYMQLIAILVGSISKSSNEYKSKSIINISIQYHIFTESGITPQLIIDNPIPNYFSFSGYNLPLSTNYKDWGNLLISKNTQGEKIINSIDSNGQFYFKSLPGRNVIRFICGGKDVLLITDILGSNSNTFTRLIDSHEYIIENGVVVFKSITRKTDFIKKIKVDNEISNNFLTLDIETRLIDNIHLLYCISLFDGSKAWSYYLSDYSSIDDMMITAIKSIMRSKYDRWNVYIHNSSNFNIIFLLRIITVLGDIDPVIKDEKFINVKLGWTSGKTTYSINFRDSLLMLPSSLRKLAKSFGVEDKGHFPFSFVNDSTVSLDYIGITPNISLFEGISSDEYNSIYSNNWSLRDQCIHYCELDCRVLHQIIYKFNELIFNKFSVNVHKYPTLSSLAFAIFRCHYLGDH
jgi:hypothetical protein